MRLLLDENLSDRMIPLIIDLYPDSLHVKALGLVNGHPPKFIYLRIGNSPTVKITQILRSNCETIAQFEEGEMESILILA